MKAAVVLSCRRASHRLVQLLCLSCSIYALLSACTVHKNGAYRHRITTVVRLPWDRVADHL